MSDDFDDEPGEEPEPTPKPERKRRSDAGRPRGPAPTGGKKPLRRFERRAEAVEKTIKELLALGSPDFDVEGLSFLEVVNRDSKAWGRFLAQLAEWLPPFGGAIDLVFGSSLITLLNLAPSFRAGRRELAERRQRIAAQRAQAEEEQEAREAIERDHVEAQRGVFPEQPSQPEPEPELTREAWLAGNGGE